MVVKNLLEGEVRKEVVKILNEDDGICSCNQCVKDIIALALNELPPCYAGSREGEVLFNNLEMNDPQFRFRILKEVNEAIEKVNQNPHHDRELR